MKRKFTALLAILAVLFISSASNSANAQRGTITIPPAYTGLAGGGTFLGPLSNAERTYQMLIRDTLLTSLVGQNITALTFRLLPSATSNWSAADVNISNYDIYISQGVAPENRSLTFSQNVIGAQKKVRSGALTIAAGSFPSGGSPTAFGTDITFDSAYHYTGGHLLIEIRHSSFSGSAASTDAVLASGGPGNGYGYLFSACWQSSYTATTGIQGNFCIAKLNSETIVGIGSQNEIVSNFSLNQNYPNPFNPSTTIEFALPYSSNVKLSVYNSLGQIVALLVNEKLDQGTYSYSWNGENFPSGTYFYRMETGEFTETKRMILVK